MKRGAIALARSAWLLGLLAALPACSSLGAAGSAPRDGVIVFHELSRGLQTWVLTTGGGELSEEAMVETRAGSIASEVNTRHSSNAESQRVASKIFGSLPSSTTIVLEPDRFATLWSRLRQTGLLDLPSYSEGDPPTDVPYFLFKSKGERRVVPRPTSESKISAVDPRADQLRTWGEAKRAFVIFLNEQ